jgi:RNA polymerase-binding transcription factor DksA
MISVRETPKGFAEARGRLLERQQELTLRQERLHADRRREAEPLSADAPDRAIQQENDAVVDSIDSAAEAELTDIAAALRRLEEGSYGVCETCAGPIDTRRLAAVPYAVQCQSCAAQAAS